MSCNGCRVLRKGCSESCILRPCLQWIPTPEAQGHATVFVAKFFGRADLMSFISAVPENQRPALFRSLLFEACGRTVNPVDGAVGLLWSGNWHLCEAAVETVLSGGALRPRPEMTAGVSADECSMPFRSGRFEDLSRGGESNNLTLSLKPWFDNNMTKKSRRMTGAASYYSEESSGTVTSFESENIDRTRFGGREQKLLNLFV
ncbi:Lateral organ boundaries, LOB [Dillenia turbinata]|uniref:Lateral organ boundaries, LOB n=1 Tax=Dillenia turbinata TaxID=194707 RepID=A0AAN8VRB0_9MAGN